MDVCDGDLSVNGGRQSGCDAKCSGGDGSSIVVVGDGTGGLRW